MRWATITLADHNGGLGIHDLDKFAWVLRLRWLWYSWMRPDRPWVGSGTPCDAANQALFVTCTVVTIDNGTTASFCHSTWVGGRPL